MENRYRTPICSLLSLFSCTLSLFSCTLLIFNVSLSLYCPGKFPGNSLSSLFFQQGPRGDKGPQGERVRNQIDTYLFVVFEQLLENQYGKKPTVQALMTDPIIIHASFYRYNFIKKEIKFSMYQRCHWQYHSNLLMVIVPNQM